MGPSLPKSEITRNNFLASYFLMSVPFTLMEQLTNIMLGSASPITPETVVKVPQMNESVWSGALST